MLQTYTFILFDIAVLIAVIKLTGLRKDSSKIVASEMALTIGLAVLVVVPIASASIWSPIHWGIIGQLSDIFIQYPHKWLLMMVFRDAFIAFLIIYVLGSKYLLAVYALSGIVNYSCGYLLAVGLMDWNNEPRLWIMGAVEGLKLIAVSGLRIDVNLPWLSYFRTRH